MEKSSTGQPVALWWEESVPGTNSQDQPDKQDGPDGSVKNKLQESRACGSAAHVLLYQGQQISSEMTERLFGNQPLSLCYDARR